MGLGKDVSTIRRGFADIEECGLIVREFDRFGKRTIRLTLLLREAIKLLRASDELRDEVKRLHRNKRRPSARFGRTGPRWRRQA